MNKNIIKQPQEIPKISQEKESNLPKSNRKSKHKHYYEEYIHLLENATLLYQEQNYMENIMINCSVLCRGCFKR